MPNLYARGILFGKMMLELGDASTVTCPATHYACDIEWKTKGWISGGYNAVAGHVRGPEGSSAGEITGHWDSVMDFKDKQHGKQTLFDATTAQVRPKTVLPEDQQEPNESRRLVLSVCSRLMKCTPLIQQKRCVSLQPLVSIDSSDPSQGHECGNGSENNSRRRSARACSTT